MKSAVRALAAMEAIVGRAGRIAAWAIAALCFALALPASADAPTAGPVKALHLTVQLVALQDSLRPGSHLDAGLYFKLDPGWHVYWVNAGDSGEPPKVKWTLPAGVTAETMLYPAPRRLPLGPLMDFGYEDEVLFPVTLHAAATVKAPASLTIPAKVDWLVCREVCIPGKAELTLPVRVSAETPNEDATAAPLFAKFRARLPQPLPEGDRAVFAPSAAGFDLAVLMGRRTEGAQFFPLEQNQIENPAPQRVTALNGKWGVQLALKRDASLHGTPATLNGVLVLGDGAAYEIHATPGALPAAATAAGITSAGNLLRANLLRFGALAFVGGIILNLMPCVFPVLFLKGLALVQSSGEERRRMRVHGAVYTLGILVSFWVVVALLLGLRASGHRLGWGFQFQSPSFIAVMALLLFFLGLSLAGMFEIGLTLTSAGSELAERGGYTGSFFTGVLAMVVATPCTAPFMGVAIGFALAQSGLVTFAIFTALALGLAAPYLLLSFNPGWTRLLPRPGAWTNTLKQATAIPIFGTVIWLVWLFVQAAGANALIGLLAAFLLVAIAGWILARWPAQRPASALALLTVALAVAMPLYALRAFAAPALAANDAGGKTAAAAATGAAGEWQPFSRAAIEKYQAQGRAVFVDYTASWCLSCQVNERVVLRRADVVQRLHDSGVVLMRADWTRHDEAIAQSLSELGRSGVPTYALFTANAPPQVLPEVLTPGIMLDALARLTPGRETRAASNGQARVASQ